METGTKDWWEDIAEKWAQMEENRDRPEEFNALMAKVDLTGNPSFLEVGCGFGDFIPYVPEKSYYIGIDIGDGMIKRAHERYPHRKFYACDFTESWREPLLPRFDYGACFQTLEHFDDETLVKVMDKFKHLVNRALLFSVPNEPKTAHLDHRQEWLTEEALISCFEKWGRVELVKQEKWKHHVGVLWYEHSDSN